MHYLRTHAGQDGKEGAWQTSRTNGIQVEGALPGWSCLGSVHAGGRSLFRKRRLTRTATDGYTKTKQVQVISPCMASSHLKFR